VKFGLETDPALTDQAVLYLEFTVRGRLHGYYLWWNRRPHFVRYLEEL